jgi:GNAT superfamily N-acetyltransferase
VKQALAGYLAEVERGLQGLPSGRRRLFLRELESHLADEAEAKGIESEAQMNELLAEKELPQELAFELSTHEDGDAAHKSNAALLAGSFIGLATGGYLWLQGGWPWHLSLAFCTAHGLAVGAGIFLVRPRWQRLGSQGRLLASVLFATLLAIPLGFTSLRGFRSTRLLYGAFTGYMLERHSQTRPPWQPVLETLGFTVLDFLVYRLVLHHRRPYDWILELSFNFTLALAVLVALHLKRMLSGRWLLAPQNPR